MASIAAVGAEPLNFTDRTRLGRPRRAAGRDNWLSPSGPLIVMYHAIGGPDGVQVGQLEQQLISLRARRRVVSLAAAVRSLGSADAQGLAAITFDDGYADFAEFAVPILRRLGLHATLFVPAGWIGAVNGWDAGRAAERRILSGRELRELDSRMVEIGAHGMTHQRMRRLDSAALHRETVGARNVLQEASGRAVNLFAFPYGQLDDFDDQAEEAVRGAGFEAACSTHFGRGSRGAERFRLRRIGITPCDSLTMVERKFDGIYDWVAWKESIGARVRGWRE